MIVRLTISGTLPGLNEYIEACRRNRYQANSMKRQCESVVMHAARKLGKWRPQGPVYMAYRWYEPNRRRDKDNVSAFGRKVIQDALVRCKILSGDGWTQIVGFSDTFEVDKKHPRIVVEIEEVDE